MRTIGTQVRGIRLPIIKKGDDLAEIIVNHLKKSWQNEGYMLKDQDVVGITESIVARSQGNYIEIDDIAEEIKQKFPSDEIGIVFPILSRNRFSMILKGIARSEKKIYLQLSYPNDEVGNPLIDEETMIEKGFNPYSDTISEQQYYKHFSDYKHPFTGVNYVDLYKEIAQEQNTEIEIILSNQADTILNYTKDILAADIHTRFKTKNRLKEAGARTVLGLDDICTEDKGKGYNKEYGLLGSNKASDTELKLFPSRGQQLVEQIQTRLKELTGKDIEVMIYGDGAFKDPAAKIWELADPVVSPAYTKGLEGTPSEVKIKYLADNDLKHLEGDKLLNSMKEEIKNKEDDLVANIKSQGTTPRRLTDLLGSLCDLVSGSGDKGTPVILIQGYFDNLADE